MNNSNLSRSSSVSFFNDHEHPSDGSQFDKWLQLEYLPSTFCHDEKEDMQKGSKKSSFRKIQCDIKELFYLPTLIISIIWILSLMCVILYLNCDCFVLSQQDSEKAETLPFDISIGGGIYANEIRITTITALSKFDFFYEFRDELIASPSPIRPEKPHPSSCVVECIFICVNFVMASMLLLYLLCYVLHLVEIWINFPWFIAELACMIVYVCTIFAFAIALCITSRTISFVVLALIQCISGMIFIFNRYEHYKSGRLPQDLSDDIDGDYVRQLKNIFHSQAKDELEERKRYAKKFGSLNKNIDMFGSKLKVDAMKQTKIKNANGKSESESKQTIQQIQLKTPLNPVKLSLK